MKTLLLAITGVCIAGGIAFHFSQTRNTAHGASVRTRSVQEEEPATKTRAPLEPAAAVPARAAANEAVPSPAAPTLPPVVPAKGPAPLPFQQALQTLTSPQASFDEKQLAWQQLKDAGKLDLAISELEQRAASNPSAAEYPAALGQAYLQKAGMLKDVREQGMLGMKADQTFDRALSLDPSNWEAGFWKAVAMSYWPPQLNKGQEVIERFAELIKLQETQPLQPQFAQTYAMLGEQYQKQGYPDYARQIWQRGAALFPSDVRLVEKLSQPQPQPAAAR